jgi:hypothetical protein
MSNIKDSKIALVALTALVIFAVYLLNRTPQMVQGAGFQTTNIGFVASSSAVTAVTSSTRILATTTSVTDSSNSYVRVYAEICNPSSTLVYLRFDGDKPASVTGYTTVIAAAAGYSACYQIRDYNQYLGSVQASSTNQTSVNVSATQYLQ